MWTTEIPESSVDFDLGAEEASLHVKNVLVFDAFTVPNSLDTRHAMGKVHAEGDHRVHVANVTDDDLQLDNKFHLDFNTAFATGPARPHGIAIR